MVEYPPEMSQAPREPGPEEVKYVRRASVYLRAAWAVGGLIAALLLGLTAWNTSLIRHGQIQSHSTLTNTATIVAAIHSCLTSGQPCYDQALKQRVETAKAYRAAVVAAVTCASTLPNVTVPTVTRCVSDALSERKP